MSRVFRALAPFLIVGTMVGTWFVSTSAQTGRPIIPTYQGWTTTSSGLRILVFGYLNPNVEPVTVPLGPDNAFSGPGGPADRGQQTTFRPGDNRFTCVMVIGPEIKDVTRWYLKYTPSAYDALRLDIQAGKGYSTTQIPFSPLYLLEEGQSGQLKDFDADKAPRNVCVNRSPRVTLVGPGGRGRGQPFQNAREVKVTLPSELRLNGGVQDDGLPRDGSLDITWSKVSGPGDVTFANAKQAATTASFSAPGSYVLRLTATDSQLASRVEVMVTVSPAG